MATGGMAPSVAGEVVGNATLVDIMPKESMILKLETTRWKRWDVGILYDDVSLQSSLDMIVAWIQEERDILRNKAPVSGLKTPFRVGLLKHVAEEVVKYAKMIMEVQLILNLVTDCGSS